jgi:hypothetical protein
MAARDVFPPEMPDDPSHPLPLDDDTAQRLLAGRLHPEDAPPGYASVASLLRAAAGPPSVEELAGQEAAMAMFRTQRERPGPGPAERPQGPAEARRRPAPAGARRRPAPAGVGRRPGPVGVRRRPSLGRSRAVALALAGTLVVGGVWAGGGTVAAGGLWIADGARTALGLGSPSGGPNSGGSGSGVPGGVPGGGAAGGTRSAGGSEALRPARGAVAGGRSPSLPSADRWPTGHGHGVTGRGARPAHGVGARGKPPKAKPPKPMPGKEKPGKAEPGKEKPKAKPAKG